MVAAELGSEWGTSATRLNPIAADFWMRSIALSHAESSQFRRLPAPARRRCSVTSSPRRTGYDWRVLPIGGVKHKLLAAHRAGLTDVIVPRRNEPDLDDVPESVRTEIHIHPVRAVAEVLSLALSLDVASGERLLQAA
jgi:Lon protease (S16) C-terminal proteolytic domain